MVTTQRKLALGVWENFVVRYIFKLLLFECISLLILSDLIACNIKVIKLTTE